MILYMDINYLINNNDEIYKLYIFDNKKIFTQIDEETFYYLFNYLYDSIFFNYLLIIFFFTCGSTIFICNYKKNQNAEYALIKNEDPIVVHCDKVEKV